MSKKYFVLNLLKTHKSNYLDVQIKLLNKIIAELYVNKTKSNN